MPDNLTGLKVFIASPGNLNDERRSFHEILKNFTFEDAHDSGIAFVPRGWEYAFAGAGRPQEKINEQIRESDYLIVVFWDKWGTRPSSEGEYTSGTEEEFGVGLQCLKDASAPMRDVVVLFKGVNDRQLSDPGDELKKVLEFKRRLERDRQVLYANFDSIQDFEHELRRHLQRWTRDWSGGIPPRKALVPDTTEASSETGESVLDQRGDLLENARAAAKAGQNTLAEQLFAQATTGSYNSDAMTEYARFLRKTGRQSASQKTSEDQLELARDAGDYAGEIEALANIALIKRARGQLRASERYLRAALEVTERWAVIDTGTESVEAQAYLLDNLSLTLARMPSKLPEAIARLRESAAIRGKLENSRGRAHTFRNLGVLLFRMGELDAAANALGEAKRIFEDEPYDRGIAASTASLGEVREFQGSLVEAENLYEDSLAINSSLNNRQGRSMNFSQLSRVLLKQGKVREASDYANRCVEINEKAGNVEGLASGLQAQGRVAREMGDHSRALRLLTEALEQFQAIDQPTGVTSSALDLAKAFYANNLIESARHYLAVASASLKAAPHAALQNELESVEKMLEEQPQL